MYRLQNTTISKGVLEDGLFDGGKDEADLQRALASSRERSERLHNSGRPSGEQGTMDSTTDPVLTLLVSVACVTARTQLRTR